MITPGGSNVTGPDVVARIVTVPSVVPDLATIVASVEIPEMSIDAVPLASVVAVPALSVPWSVEKTIAAPEIGSLAASISRADSLAVALGPLTELALDVSVSVVPVTWMVELLEYVPALALTVTVRFDRS
jgi:hypothetical protein